VLIFDNKKLHYLEAMASIRALNDMPFLHAHRGVTAAQIRAPLN